MGTAFRGETSPYAWEGTASHAEIHSYAWVRVGSGAPPGVSASKGGGVRGPNSMGKTRSKPPETADPTPSAGSGVPWLLGPFSRVLGASGDSGGTASAWRGEGGRRGGGSLTCERGARRGRTGGRTGGRGTPVCGAGVSGQGGTSGDEGSPPAGRGARYQAPTPLPHPCLTPASRYPRYAEPTPPPPHVHEGFTRGWKVFLWSLVSWVALHWRVVLYFSCTTQNDAAAPPLRPPPLAGGGAGGDSAG